MAFVVEDGTGKDDSNSYSTIDQYKTYFTDRNKPPTETDAEIQAGLILATEFADMNYLYVGDRGNIDQALDWPRVGAVATNCKIYNSTDIPSYLINAIAELAKIAMEYDTLEPDIIEEILLSAQSQGPVSVSYKSGKSRAATMPIYRKASKWLGYITNTNQLKVERV